jgi:hypothetical protein
VSFLVSTPEALFVFTPHTRSIVDEDRNKKFLHKRQFLDKLDKLISDRVDSLLGDLIN